MLSIKQLTSGFSTGALTPTEHAEATLKRLEAPDIKFLNPIVKIFPREVILQQAAESTLRYQQRKNLGPFDGILFSIKNTSSSALKGEKINKGSVVIHLDRNNEFIPVPQESVKEVRMLLKSGAICFCMTTVPEMCWTGSTATYLYGITRNPSNPLLTTGGSSGGAGVLAFLGIGSIHIGTDGLGSIRNPAACCGVIGYKGSYALCQSGVNNNPEGKYPYLSNAGPLCKHIEDVILFVRELIKYTKISTHLDLSPSFIQNDNKLKGLSIAVSKNLNGNVDYIEPIVWQQVLKVAKTCEKLGATITFVEPQLPTGSDSYINCCTILWYEICKKYGDYIKKFSGEIDLESCVDPGLLECIKRVDKIQDTLPKMKKDIQLVRKRTKKIMSDFHKKYDVLITPTMPILPLKAQSYLKHGYMYNRNTNKLEFIFDCRHNLLVFTELFNFTQQPAISLNVGFAQNKFGKIPIGCQVIADNNRDDLVLKTAYWLNKTIETSNNETLNSKL